MTTVSPSNPTSIQQMFGTIARNYDRANSAISLGLHMSWKRRLIQESEIQLGARVLDCATGTGDLAFLFEEELDRLGEDQNGYGSVVGTDFCKPMLEIAQGRSTAQGSACHFEWADVTQLPYENSEFDVASISYGLRNVNDPAQAMSELARVVKPGGRVLVLETGQPRWPGFQWAYRLYSSFILPLIGGLLSGKFSAYRYLEKSSSKFPSGQEFLKLTRAPELFEQSKVIPFFGGVSYLYVFKKSGG